jgi:hypothetical protein
LYHGTESTVEESTIVESYGRTFAPSGSAPASSQPTINKTNKKNSKVFIRYILRVIK